jgi:hypothetical protein
MGLYRSLVLGLVRVLFRLDGRFFRRLSRFRLVARFVMFRFIIGCGVERMVESTLSLFIVARTDYLRC